MQIIKITVTLRGVQPIVSRTLEVPVMISLDRLHEALQAAFGWDNAHLYQFCIGEPYQLGVEHWVMPDFADGSEDLPADGSTLTEAIHKAGDAGLTYLYDFGDDWIHDITVPAPTDADPMTSYPQLTEITGNCPPENIGGPPGYYMFAEAMADPEHPEHSRLKEWYGGSFDPDKPNKKALTASVAKLAKKWAI